MSNGLPPLRYRGSHGNLRLWRECKTPQLFGVSGAVLVEAGSSCLYRREYVHDSFLVRAVWLTSSFYGKISSGQTEGEHTLEIGCAFLLS